MIQVWNTMGRAARTEHLFTIATGMQTQSVEHLGNRDALFGTVPRRFLPKNRNARKGARGPTVMPSHDRRRTGFAAINKSRGTRGISEGQRENKHSTR
jgi:hypothetical protein